MKKFQIVFLFVFFAGCSPGTNVSPVETLSTIQTPTLAPTQTAIPPTETSIPTSTFTPLPTATALGGGGGKIAFTSERDGYAEIYVINPDGSGLTKLTNDITPKFSPAWSPDGKKMAFGTNNNDIGALYIMNADGSNPTKLIDTKEIDTYDQATSSWRFASGCCNPVWSPDGTKIAFKVAYYIGCCFTSGYTHVLNADGSYLISAALAVWENPVWSPDGQKIAIGTGCEYGVPGICIMNADGTTPVMSAIGNETAGWPSWSPDGKK
jgi:TolB protein